MSAPTKPLYDWTSDEMLAFSDRGEAVYEEWLEAMLTDEKLTLMAMRAKHAPSKRWSSATSRCHSGIDLDTSPAVCAILTAP